MGAGSVVCIAARTLSLRIEMVLAVVGNPAELLPVRVGAVGVAFALGMVLVLSSTE